MKASFLDLRRKMKEVLSALDRNESGEEAQIADKQWSEALEYRPRTPLGRKLMEIRKKIVASGEALLDWDDIEREISESRGEIE